MSAGCCNNGVIPIFNKHVGLYRMWSSFTNTITKLENTHQQRSIITSILLQLCQALLQHFICQMALGLEGGKERPCLFWRLWQHIDQGCELPLVNLP